MSIPVYRTPLQGLMVLTAALAMLLASGPAAAQCPGIPSAPPNGGGGSGSGVPDARGEQGSVAEGLFPVQGNSAMGLINRGGYLAIDRSWDWVDYAFGDTIRAIEGGRTGYADIRGRWTINPVYVYADRFEDGYAVVGDGEHFGIIDRRGELIVPARLDGALRFREGLAAVQVGENVGFIDVRGEVVVDIEFARVRSFHGGLAAFTTHASEGRAAVHGYLNKRGDIAWSDQTGQVQELRDFNDNLAAVRIGNKWGYLSRRFRGEIPPRFDEARDFAEGYAAVRVGDQWGFIDRSGDWHIRPQYEDADEFQDGYAMVMADGLWGYVDRRGELAIPARYEYAEPFFRGYARVQMAPNFGYIDASGRPMWDPGAAGVQAPQTDAERKPWLTSSEQGLSVADASPLGPYQAEHRYEEVLPVLDNDQQPAEPGSPAGAGE